MCRAVTEFAAIVLAAGEGRRFGRNKMLAEIEGAPLVTRALAAACASPVKQVIAVVGAEADRVSAVIREAAPSVTIVMAGDYAEGMAASLRAGLGAVAEDVDAVAIFLGDMPDVPHGLAGQLFAALGESPAAAPVHDGRRGHPAVFARSLFPRLMALSGDTGARDLFRDLGEGWGRVPCDDPGIFRDIDVPPQS